MKQLESSVENSFVRKCKKLKVTQIKLGYDTLPDRMALIPGDIIFIEFKRPGEDLRKNQEATVKKLRRLGFKVYVIDNNKDAINLAVRLSEAK
jgi:hypothetical protein